MHCIRCQGLMVETHYLDLDGGFGEMWTQSWRCVNCGHVHDAVAERNRRARPETVHVSETPGDQEDDTYLISEAFVRRAA